MIMFITHHGDSKQILLFFFSRNARILYKCIERMNVSVMFPVSPGLHYEFSLASETIFLYRITLPDATFKKQFRKIKKINK